MLKAWWLTIDRREKEDGVSRPDRRDGDRREDAVGALPGGGGAELGLVLGGLGPGVDAGAGRGGEERDVEEGLLGAVLLDLGQGERGEDRQRDQREEAALEEPAHLGDAPLPCAPPDHDVDGEVHEGDGEERAHHRADDPEVVVEGSLLPSSAGTCVRCRKAQSVEPRPIAWSAGQRSQCSAANASRETKSSSEAATSESLVRTREGTGARSSVTLQRLSSATSARGGASRGFLRGRSSRPGAELEPEAQRLVFQLGRDRQGSAVRLGALGPADDAGHHRERHRPQANVAAVPAWRQASRASAAPSSRWPCFQRA